MQIRMFAGRVSVSIMRSKFYIKLLLTVLILLSMFFTWYLFLHRPQSFYVKNIVIEIDSLKTQKNIFDSVLVEYENLKNKHAVFFDSNKSTSVYRSTWIIKNYLDAAKMSGLELQFYNKKKINGGSTQITFSFLGGYQNLKSFLRKISSLGLDISCRRLKVSSPDGCKLQIDYVCGIHTVKK